MAKHLKVHLSLALCVALILSMFTMCFTASASTTYAYDFTGSSGEANAAELLANATHISGATAATAEIANVLTVGYDSTSAAFEVAIPYYYINSLGESKSFLSPVNGVVFNTPENATAESLKVVTGSDDANKSSLTYGLGVVIAKGSTENYTNAVRMIRLGYNGGFKLWGYTISQKKLVSSDGVHEHWQYVSTTEINGSSGVGTQLQAIYVDGVLATTSDGSVTADRSQMTSSQISTYFPNYNTAVKNFELPFPTSFTTDTFKTMKYGYDVKIADGNTVVTTSIMIESGGKTYEMVFAPVTIDSAGAVTYMSNSTGLMNSTSHSFDKGTFAGAFGVMNYGNTNNATYGNVTGQIYSVNATYAGGQTGGDDTCDHVAGEAAKENVVEANCEEGGSYDNVVKCTLCGEELSRETITVDALGHTEVVDEAVDATCEDTGLTEGKHCSVCNKVLVEQTVVNALGHTEVVDEAVDATCEDTGLTEGKHCSVCNKVLVEQTVVNALGHSYNAVVTPPAVGVQGYTTYTCSVCGDSYVSDYVDPISKEIRKTATVVLDGKVNVIVTATPNFETDAMVITINGETYDMVKGANGEFTYTIERYAHQMTETFEISIEADGVAATGTISIAGVLESVHNSAADEETKALAIATANYGAAAQVYFGNTDVLANEWVPEADKTTDYTYGDAKTVDMNTNIADAYNEMSLSAAVQLGNEIKMVVIFGHEDFADKNLKVTCEGQELTVVKNTDGRFYVISDGIAPADMDTGYDFVITADGEEVATFTYSVNNYIKNLGAATTDANLIALLNAMVAYGAAANNY